MNGGFRFMKIKELIIADGYVYFSIIYCRTDLSLIISF